MTRYLAPLLLGLAGVAVLVGLGVWQLQRLTWKTELLARIDAKMAADPVALPEAPDPMADEFLPVRIDGTLTGTPLFVFTTLPRLGVRLRVIQTLETPDGRRVLLDRGAIDPAASDKIATKGGVAGTGILRWPDETDFFTPGREQPDDLWYARDVGPMSKALGTEPVLVVAQDLVPADPLVVPVIVDTSGIPNNHQNYAVTWFGLAVVWAGMTLLWVHRIAQSARLRRFRER